MNYLLNRRLVCIFFLAALITSCSLEEEIASKASCDIYEESAKQGSANGQLLLAHCFRTGEGRSKNLATAESLLNTAIDENYIDAKHYLASIYLFEYDTEEKRQAAIELLQEAAETGYAKSYFLLGLVVLNGLGIEKDALRAWGLFLKAAQEGHNESVFMMMAGSCYGAIGFSLNDELCEVWEDQFVESSGIFSQEEYLDYVNSYIIDDLFRTYIFSLDELNELKGHVFLDQGN